MHSVSALDRSKSFTYPCLRGARGGIECRCAGRRHPAKTEVERQHPDAVYDSRYQIMRELLDRRLFSSISTIVHAWPLAIAWAVRCAIPVLLSLPAFAHDLPAPVSQALKRAGIPTSATALYVHEIGAPQPRVAVNAKTGMNPASVM